MAKSIKMLNPTFCYFQEKHLNSESKHRLKGRRTIIQANNSLTKARVVIFLSDDTDFRLEKVIRDRDGHFLIIWDRCTRKKITLLNIYAPNEGPGKYLKQLLI